MNEPQRRHLLQTLINQDEDGLTELLAALLRDSGLRAAFVRSVVGVEGASDPELAALVTTTQEWTSDGSCIPDLRLRSETLHVVVENKLGAQFTDSQPHGYLRDLVGWRDAAAGRRAILVVQAPESRLGSLAREVWERLHRPDVAVSARRAMVGDIDVAVVSWERTANVFAEVPVSDPVASWLRDGFVRHIRYDVARSWSHISRSLTEVHVKVLGDVGVHDAMSATYDALDALREVLVGRRERVQASVSTRFFIFGLNVDAEDRAREWIGVLHRAAAKHGASSPMFIGFENLDEAGRHRLKGAGFESYTSVGLAGWGPNWWICPLALVGGLDAQEQALQLRDQIDRARAAISNARGLGYEAAP